MVTAAATIMAVAVVVMTAVTAMAMAAAATVMAMIMDASSLPIPTRRVKERHDQFPETASLVVLSHAGASSTSAVVVLGLACSALLLRCCRGATPPLLHVGAAERRWNHPPKLRGAPHCRRQLHLQLQKRHRVPHVIE
jgi:hypothetical protein